MPRLTLRTLLAYMDDTLPPAEARTLGRKVAESNNAQQLVERIKKVTRRRGLSTPVQSNPDDETADPNTVAEFLDNTLDSATLKQVEETCLESDVHLAEVAACHQILTLVLTEPVRVPPGANQKMYRLVKPPASDPHRRPGNTLPVGGIVPREQDQPDADDADAALLLGMSRYSATKTWAARLVLFGVAAALLVFLAGAILMALPPQQPKPPDTSAGHSFAQVKDLPPPPQRPTPPNPPPDPLGGKKPVEPVVVEIAPEPRPAGTPVDPGPGPGPVLGDPVGRPLIARREIARVETQNVLVVTQPFDGGDGWLRLRMNAADDERVISNDPVMALPGYKANLLIDNKVQVHLWGNVPEQLTYRVFESRVVIHPPPSDYDADITLLAGRIYIQSKKLAADRKTLTGAKVRVRVASEVWDITLADGTTDVMVELISWYEPGTPFARKEGVQPKQEARCAVLVGSASLHAPARPKKIDRIAKDQQVLWDSSSGALPDPKPVENPQEAVRVPVLDGNQQRLVTGVLTEMAGLVSDRGGIGPVVKKRLEPDATAANRDLVARLAIYARVALADVSPTGADTLRDLVDLLKSELPWQARQAVVTALAQWVARDRGNTVLLHAVFVAKGLGDGEADRLLELLRAFISPVKPDAARLDKLVEFLGDPTVALREAALWNIVAADQESWIPLPVGVNVGAVGAAVTSEEYKKFLAFMKGRIETIKKRVPPK